jgi:hypothetical protein
MFLAVFATHGTAHIALFDQPMRQSRIVRFAPLSILIYDEFAIGLYHLICALYFGRTRNDLYRHSRRDRPNRTVPSIPNAVNIF